MSRFHPIKNSFVAGELSPRLEGRDDLEQYHQGLRQSENGITLPHGGWQRRPGTEFVAEVRNSNVRARLIPFIFSVDTAYVIVANGGFFRYFSNETPVVSVGAFDDGALFDDGGGFSDNADPIQDAIPFSASELAALQWAQTGNVLYFAHPNHPPQRLRRVSSSNFTFEEVPWRGGRAPMLSANVTDTTLQVTGGSSPFTITASDDVFDFTGGTDVGRTFLIHGDTTDRGWYKIVSVTSTTVATATREGGDNISGDAANANWSAGMFSDTDGPRAIAFHENRLWYGGCPRDEERIAGSDSGVFTRFSEDATLDDNAVYVSTASTGQIQTVQWLASTDKALWVGCAGGEGVIDAAEDAILTPSSARFRGRTKRGSIHLMPVLVDSDILFLQRDARKLRRISFELASDRYGAADISILAEHILKRGGGAEMAYQQSPDSVVWIVRGDGQLVGFTIEPEQKVIGAHRHIVGGVSDLIDTHALIESACVIPNPDGTQDQLWVVVNRYIDGGTKRYVEFVKPPFDPAVTPQSTSEELTNALDGAWFLDRALELNNPKTITGITQASPGVVTAANHGLLDGQTVLIRGVNGMTEVNRRAFTVSNATTNTFELQTDAAYPLNVDTSSYTAYISGGEVRAMVETVSGLDHLEGETVAILADAAAHPNKTVSGGAVTLDRKAARVLVGLHRKAFAETQRFVGGGQLGSDQGQRARIQRLAIRFHNTVECNVGVGPDPTNLERILFREGNWVMDGPPPLFSGDMDVPLEGAWSRTPTIYFEQDAPLPLTVLAVMPRAESGER